MVIKNLVMEGGGISGIALAGSCRYLWNVGVYQGIERFAGTSAGAITAMLCAFGYTPEEIAVVLFNTDFSLFRDRQSWSKSLKNFIRTYGLYSGDYFEIWLKDKIQKKAKCSCITFREMKEKGFKDLYVVGSNVSNGYSKIFSYEHTPDMHVHTAVRISMGIPFFFSAVKMDGEVWCDGGLMSNMPSFIFDNEKYSDDPEAKYFNRETLCLRLDTTDQIAILKDGQEPPKGGQIKTVIGYIEALVESLLNRNDNLARYSREKDRTVFIDRLGIGATYFEITENEKEALYESGMKCANDFFVQNFNCKKMVGKNVL